MRRFITRKERALLWLAVTWIILLYPTATPAGEEEDIRRLINSAGLAYSKKSEFPLAPDFAMTDVRTGARFTLKRDFEDRVVLINLWATWCPPCRKEMPTLQALYDEFKDRGFVVLGVNVYELRGDEKSKQFAEQWNLNFPMVTTDGWAGPKGYTAMRVPTTYLVDRRGRLIGERVGDQDWTVSSVKTLVSLLLEDDPQRSSQAVYAPSRQGSISALIHYAYFTTAQEIQGNFLRRVRPLRVKEFVADENPSVALVLAVKHMEQIFQIESRWYDGTGVERKVVRRTMRQAGVTGERVWQVHQVSMAELRPFPGDWRVALTLNGKTAGEYRFRLVGAK